MAPRLLILFALLAGLLVGAGDEGRAEDKRATPVVIPNVKGTATTTKFGDGYITRGSDGTRYTTSKFGHGWITRSSDGTTTTTQRFGQGSISRSTSGTGATSSKFGSGYISRENKSGGTKDQGVVRVIPAPKSR